MSLKQMITQKGQTGVTHTTLLPYKVHKQTIPHWVKGYTIQDNMLSKDAILHIISCAMHSQHMTYDKLYIFCQCLVWASVLLSRSVIRAQDKRTSKSIIIGSRFAMYKQPIVNHKIQIFGCFCFGGYNIHWVHMQLFLVNEDDI